MSWDAELQRKSRKNLEGHDNYVAYRHSKFFEKSNLEFLSPNTTPQVQPVDMGVTKNLKTYVTQSW
jgi:hypothetical protein